LTRLRKSDRRAVNIAEVAALAGVSTATVSRALSEPSQLRPDTLARVNDAVAKTGYMPNVAARTLRARRSMVVLVVVPDIGNPFFSEVLRGIEDELSQHNYGLLIGNIGIMQEHQAQIVGIVQAGQVDGVILLNGHVPSKDGRDLVTHGIPMVAVCEPIPGGNFPQVDVRNRESAGLAVAHLARLGHRSLAYLGGPQHNILERERQAGFRDGLRACGLTARGTRFFAGDFTMASGAVAAEQFLASQPRPTALFAANDEMAIGFIKTVRGAGLRVPDDVSVFGFDGIAFADFVEPTLTTFRQPRRELGRIGAGLLLRRIAGEPMTPDEARVHLDAVLLDRASTAMAPRSSAQLRRGDAA
jgi:LacI family repressor for deo operon, udp, cdd, tsx, nupC, and nupG